MRSTNVFSSTCFTKPSLHTPMGTVRSAADGARGIANERWSWGVGVARSIGGLLGYAKRESGFGRLAPNVRCNGPATSGSGSRDVPEGRVVDPGVVGRESGKLVEDRLHAATRVEIRGPFRRRRPEGLDAFVGGHPEHTQHVRAVADEDRRRQAPIPQDRPDRL